MPKARLASYGKLKLKLKLMSLTGIAYLDSYFSREFPSNNQEEYYITQLLTKGCQINNKNKTKC
jgi:hypothetical protein